MAASEDEKAKELQSRTLQVTVCGGGNGSHAFIATVSSKLSDSFKVNWFSLYADEAEKLNNIVSDNNGYVSARFKGRNDSIIKGKPNIISKDGSKVIPNSDIIILCVPAFAHSQYLDEINKHHEICNGTNKNKNKKLIIGAFPSACGLEFAFLKKLNNIENNIILCNATTLPWACRIEEYGKSVEILGLKSGIDMFISGNNNLLDNVKPLDKLQSLFMDFMPKLIWNPKIHILSSTLGTLGPVVHCSVMYDKWSDYDGKEEFDKKPLFYQGISKDGAKLMSGLRYQFKSIFYSLFLFFVCFF